MKAYGGVGVQIHIFLNSALAGGECSASIPGRFTPGERTLSTHWIGGWVDPRTGLDDVEKRKFVTLPGLELRPLGRPTRSQPLYRIRYSGSSTKKSSDLIGNRTRDLPACSIVPQATMRPRAPRKIEYVVINTSSF
jgi:hypothetical protein